MSGPRPLKRFTPPPEGEEEYDSEDEYTDEEYSDEDDEEDSEEEDDEDEDDESEKKPKYKDEVLEMVSQFFTLYNRDDYYYFLFSVKLKCMITFEMENM